MYVRMYEWLSLLALRNIIEKVSEDHEATGNEIVEIFGDGNQAAAGSSLPSKMAAPAGDSSSSGSKGVCVCVCMCMYVIVLYVCMYVCVYYKFFLMFSFFYCM